MSSSRRFRSARSVRRTVLLVVLFTGAIEAVSPPAAAAREPATPEPAPAEVDGVPAPGGTSSPATAAGAPPAASPAAAKDALRDAVHRFERTLRRRLSAVELGAAPAAGTGDSERLFRRLKQLRSAAWRLEADGGGELERKLRALRPLLLDLVRAEAGTRRSSPSPWRAAPGRAAASLSAADHSSCAAALAAGDGVWRSGLGERADESGELWLRYTAPAAGWAAVDTAGSDLDTVVEVFAACPAAGEAPLVRGDDEVGLQARAAFRVAAGESRWIRIGGWRGASGSLVVALGGGVTGITGTVTEQATGLPVVFEDVAIWDQTGSFATSGFTDSTGGYLVLGLSPGTYFVSTELFSTGGLLDELYDDVPCPGGVFGGGCDPTAGTPVVVQSGSLAEDVDFALGPGATVIGRVRDAATGGVVAFAEVQFFGPNGDFVAGANADAAGRYRVEGLGNGEVFAIARGTLHSAELYEDLPCTLSCDPTTGTPIPVTVGAVTSGIDFSLDRRGALAGRLTATGGAPVPFEEVEIFDAGGFFIDFGFTDEQGDYAVGGLDAGQYFVVTRTFEEYLDELYDDLPCEPSCDPTTGTPVPVVSGATTGAIDFELRLRGRIDGRVTDAATAEGIGATIWVFDASGSFVDLDFTGSGGVYSVTGLAAGTYFVTAEDFFYFGELYDDLPCPGGFPPGCDPTTGTPVAVQIDLPATGIDFALERLGSIEGTVTDAVSGDPLGSTQVLAYDSNGQLLNNGFTDALGRYELSPLGPGTHFVIASSPEHFAELYDDLPCPGGAPAGCDPTTGTPIPVVLGGTVAGIDFALSPLGVIEGAVTEAGTGLPVSSALINVWNAAGATVGNGETDGLGHYRLPGLDTGTYFVTVEPFTHAGELYDDLPCPAGGCDPTTGTPVAVVAGSTTAGIDFAVERLGSLSGRLTASETGEPLFNGFIVLYDASGAFVDATSVFDTDGRYRFSAVRAGTFFVVADGFPDYTAELYDGFHCPGGACDPTAGTPVAVTNGVETAGIDFALDVATGIVGVVTGDLGMPVPGVAIDLWSTAGDLVQSTATGPTGFYRLTPFDAGTYFVSTDNGQGLIDELYDDVACPLGPAFEGLCDPLDGDPVVLPSFDSLVDGVDFQLTPSLSIFSDGFESGDTAAWSSSVP